MKTNVGKHIVSLVSVIAMVVMVAGATIQIKSAHAQSDPWIATDVVYLMGCLQDQRAISLWDSSTGGLGGATLGIDPDGDEIIDFPAVGYCDAAQCINIYISNKTSEAWENDSPFGEWTFQSVAIMYNAFVPSIKNIYGKCYDDFNPPDILKDLGIGSNDTGPSGRTNSSGSEGAGPVVSNLSTGQVPLAFMDPTSDADPFIWKLVDFWAHPEKYPLELMEEYTDSNLLVVGVTFPRLDIKYTLHLARFLLLYDPGCFSINESGIMPLGEFPKSLNNSNRPGNIHVIAPGFGIFKGKLQTGPMFSIPFQRIDGEGCASEKIDVELVEVVERPDDDDDSEISLVEIVGMTTLQFRASTGDRALVEISCFNAKGSVVPEDDGSWQFDDVPPGPCTLQATAPGYLPAEVSLVVGSDDIVLSSNNLLAGEIDGNDFVNINDITGVIAQFGKVAENCEIEGVVVDLDCNNFININDITGAITNFGKGTQPF